MYRKLAIHLKQPLKHWHPLMLLVTQKPQNYSGNDHLKQNCLFCRNICSTVEVLISPWQLESNITADWNFRACHIYVPDGRDFGAVNQCEFELLGLSEMGKRGRDANRCCFLEAGATTKHHEDMEKGLSDASKRDFLNKKLMHVQWSARSVSTHTCFVCSCCQGGTTPTAALEQFLLQSYRREDLNSLLSISQINLLFFSWRNA